MFGLVDSYIVLVPCSRPCSIEERKRREEMEQEGRDMSLCNYPDFLGKPTHSEASISLSGPHTASFFSFTIIFVFILHTVA